MANTLEELLNQLHEMLAKEFLKVIQEGDAPPATLNAARQLLKDNGITLGAGGGETEDLLSKLERELADAGLEEHATG